MGRRNYKGAPWTFRGHALYQLNLVRASEARKHVPEALKLVSIFGWTLGGVYLARYSDSPVGAFDELVVLAGLVWNAPTSCAWAQRVYVSNAIARSHGLKSVGLPSRLASFAQAEVPRCNTAAMGQHKGRHTQCELASMSKPPAQSADQADVQAAWWNVQYAPHRDVSSDHAILVGNCERRRRALSQPVARLLLPSRQAGWTPRIRMQLPNFSGATLDHPSMLHYSCQLQANVRPLLGRCIRAIGAYDPSHTEDVSHVLCGQPLLCMEFKDMVMEVPKPAPFTPSCGRLLQRKMAVVPLALVVP